MSERRKLGRLVLEESGVNDAHAHVRVFDAGAFCGALTLSRGTWDGLKVVEDPPAGGGDAPPSISESVRTLTPAGRQKLIDAGVPAEEVDDRYAAGEFDEEASGP